MTRFRILTATLILQITASIILLGVSLFQGSEQVIIIVEIIAVILMALLLIAHLRHWPWSAHVTIIAATLLTIVGNPAEITLRQISLTIISTPVLAAIFLPWYWSIGTFIVIVIGVGLQSTWQGPLFVSDTLIIAFSTTLGIALVSAVSMNAQKNAEQHALRAEKALAQAEMQTRELAQQTKELEYQNEQQRTLLELVAALETPAIALAEGVLLAPVVGHLDSRRANTLTLRLLQAVNDQRTFLVILDIAGVVTVDTNVAKALLQTAQSLRLLGCKIAITGISAAVAITITHLGIELDDIATARTPQDVLSNYLASQARVSTQTSKNGITLHHN